MRWSRSKALSAIAASLRRALRKQNNGTAVNFRESQSRPELSIARLVGRQERAPGDAVGSNHLHFADVSARKQRFRKEKPMPSLISRVRLLAICMQICFLVPACLSVGSPSFARINFDG